MTRVGMMTEMKGMMTEMIITKNKKISIIRKQFNGVISDSISYVIDIYILKITKVQALNLVEHHKKHN